MDILELLKGQISGPLMERMGAVLGLDAAQARSIGQAVLPAQVAVLRQKAATEAGSQHLLDLAAQLPQTAAQTSIETPEGLEQVRQSGTALLPQLLGNRLDDTVQQVAAQTGTGRSGVQGMMQMILPLVLGTLGEQASRLGLNAGSLGGLFTGETGAAAGGLGGAVSGLGAAAVGLGGVAAAGLSGAAGKLGEGVSGLGDAATTGLGNATAGLGDAAGKLGGSLSQGVGNATSGLGNAAAGLGGAAAGLGTAATAGIGNAASRVGAGVTGLGGAGTDGMATVSPGAGLNGGVLHTNPALGGRRGMGWLWLLPLLLLLLLGGCFLLRGKPAVALALTDPANASSVTGAFAIKGTGTAGQAVTVSENGQQVAATTVGEDGHFSADVPEPSAGAHTYAVAEAGDSTPQNLTVTATPAATPAATTAATGAFAVTSPANASTLPAGAFEMKGTGKPGDVLEIFEDGVSLGKVTVGADGTWSLNVPSPAAGAHTYTVKGPDGTELGRVQTTVAASAASAADCTKSFSLSIPDGQAVAEPFRFGGVGSGKSYTVTVMRGDHKIGSKLLPLDGTCGYSYTSKPGKGTITYSVAPTGSGDVAGKITLTVK